MDGRALRHPQKGIPTVPMVSSTPAFAVTRIMRMGWEESVQHSDSFPDADGRVTGYTHGSELDWVVAVLGEQREEILSRWLEAVAAQPFHHGHRERAVADHIPQLFDALVGFMAQTASRTRDPGAPLDDPAILAAARGHALVRVEQGLQPADVLTEFRLLRQELWHALRLALPDSAPTTDVVAAELLINDTLDGASALALTALTDQLDQVREEFFATTVHELRQPLTKITGYAQLANRILDRPSPDLVRVRDGLSQIREASNRLESLLEVLVDVSRAALGAIPLQTTGADLFAITHAAIAQLSPDLIKRVEVHSAPDLDPLGEWDQPRLGQVLNNLLTNAGKYSPPDAPITVLLTGDVENATVSVQDRGFGIPTEDLPRLFDRYTRARNAVDEGIDGLGLGLYLCRGIIEAHGGRIWAESPGIGQGAIMHFTVPRHLPRHLPES